ncbi:hypothetical protein [Ascidiaceihabitans sp.]|uniref:hypothetical protein n=1 Tax=Ascidiaceihabitans sp. TaxID=1872644 RepID=UPI0032971655
MWYFTRIFILALLAVSSLASCTISENRFFSQSDYDRGDRAVAACIEIECRTLNLDGSPLRDYTVLNGLKHVTVLMVSRTNFVHLDDIADMSHLTELHIRETQVTDLSGLVHFPKLKTLHVSLLHQGVDPAPIANLTSLVELAVTGREDETLDYISSLQNLKNLRVDGGQISGISPLLDLKALRQITLYSELPEDLFDLTKIKNIYSISLLDKYLTPEFQSMFDNRSVVFVSEPIIIC